MSGPPRVPQPQDNDTTIRYGREYQDFSIEHRVYPVPAAVDEREGDRLDAQHEIYQQVFDGLFLPPGFPATDDDLVVLDCGYGNGAWAGAVANAYEDWDVTGVDIYVADGDEDLFITKRWNLNAPSSEDHDELRQEMYDLINSRNLAEGIRADRWRPYIRELMAMLKPGGWLQMIEVENHVQSDAGRLGEAVALESWWQWYARALGMLDRNPRIGRELVQRLRDRGFENVGARQDRLPIGDWDPTKPELGRRNLENMMQSLESLSLWPFIHVLAWTPETTARFIRAAQADLLKPGLRLYVRVYSVFGRRPRRRRR